MDITGQLLPSNGKSTFIVASSKALNILMMFDNGIEPSLETSLTNL